MRTAIKSNPVEIEGLVRKVFFSLSDEGVILEDGDIFRLRLALEEAVLNAMKHGNKFNEDLVVGVEVLNTDGEIVLRVEDQGQGFNYNRIADPTQGSNLLKTSGRGVFLIRNIMDRVEFNDKGNVITMRKKYESK